MGTFMGHVLPGSIFLAFALWWTIQISIRYFRSKLRNGQTYRSTATFPCSCLCGRLGTWQFEGFMKMIWCAIGLSLEIVTGMNEQGQFVHIGNGQHATMFFIFGFNGLVDILIHHGVSLPKDFDYITMIIAFAVEGVLFKFHLHGRTPLDIQLHTLLVYVVVINVLTVIAEMRWPKNVLVAFSRAYFVLLQGTWFWQVGFILYNPLPGAKEWDGDDHEQMMVTTIIFGWHMILDLMLMMMIGLIINCIIRRCSYGSVSDLDDDLGLTQLIKRDANGQTFVSLNEESDNDTLEYDRPILNGNQN